MSTDTNADNKQNTEDEAVKTEESTPAKVTNDTEALGEAGQKALREERRGRKDAESLAASLQERIDTITAEKDAEIEKLKAAIAEKDRAAELAQVRTLRAEKVAAAGLPLEAADFITATDETDIEAQIERLAQLGGDRQAKRFGYTPELGQRGKTTSSAHQAFGDLMRQALNRN